MNQYVQVTLESGVLTVTLNRPAKKNAINNDMYAALTEALARGEREGAVRAILFTGAGGEFSAGNDLADFAAVAAGKMERSAMRSGDFLQTLARAEKPLVAAVQGVAVGIGVTLLLHCDVSIVADDAMLSTPFVNLAVVPEAASSLLLPARIGYAQAYALFAFGEPMRGDQAAAIGLVTEAVPKAEVDARALTLARSLAARPAGALRATKRLMRDTAQISAVMQKENEIFGGRLGSPEAAEAFRAFAERRPPDYSKFD